MKIAICWFRNDLRLHDNPIWIAAHQLAGVQAVLPVYCFDPRHRSLPTNLANTTTTTATTTPTMEEQQPRTYIGDFPRTANFRWRFLVESVHDLKESLMTKHGYPLLLGSDRPEVCLPNLVAHLTEHGHQVHTIFCQREISSEETNVEEAVRKAVLRKGNVKLETPWGLTLYHPDDMPFAWHECPDTFTSFRKICETQCTVRPLLPTRPLADKPFPLQELKNTLPAGFLPAKTTEDLRLHLGVGQIQPDPRGIHLVGGETAGLERVDSYLFQTDAIAKYKETRNGLIGLQYSSKFSPYLAHGCLSPREIYFAIQRYEQTRLKNDSTYWLVFELLWRDFFKFIGLRHGDRLFYRSGLMGVRNRAWSMEAEKFRQWQQGQTGVPWVDAAMRELLHTGFMSNRSRQNVASFLTQSLGMDWRLGAAWFESMLIDHDVHANYGNWQYTAGVGNDPRESRKFNMIKQARDYDPQGEYIRLWCPELKQFPAGSLALFMPWKLQERIPDYPGPMILEPEWERHGTGRRNDDSKGPRRSDWKVKKFGKEGRRKP